MADAIWNDRYILSNMTSEKLYAKSPLTTGVSGTSAYIGLEPSATYNETVLWETTSGARLKDGIDLSESRLNFERLKIYLSNSEGNNQEVGIYEWPQYGQNTGTMFRWGTLFPYNTNSGGFMLMWNIMGSANNTHIQSNNAYYLGVSNFTGGAGPSLIGGNNSVVPTVFKVIGINRKEV